jgi:trans-aconitate methyltransferase
MSRPRVVVAEWLDVLPHDDPEAMQSRRDLGLLNACMFQAGIMERLLTRLLSGAPPRRVVELGSGDGTFMLRLARRLASRWPGVRVVLVDRQDVVAHETRAGFRAVGWHAETVVGDVFEFLGRCGPGMADAVIANLFLHHLERGQLVRLFERVAELSPLFAACEPRRHGLAVVGSRRQRARGVQGQRAFGALACCRRRLESRGASERALHPLFRGPPCRVTRGAPPTTPS